jgi:hypothetical protein
MAQSREAFIQMLMPAAIEAAKRTGIDPRIIVAQAAQETGWGRSAPGNNYFGIKSHGQGGGQTFTTHEVINGQRVKMNDSFRQFGSPGESVAGYADFMTQNKRYAPMRQAEGLDAQLQALGRSGYATDPNYSQSVGAIARSIPFDGSLPTNPAGRLGGDSLVPRDQSAQIATQTNTPAPLFGSMSPGGGMMAPDNSIDPNVANYAFGEDKPGWGERLKGAGAAFDSAKSEVKPPRIAPMPSPSGDVANGLTKLMQNPSALAQMLLKRRLA